MPTIIGCIFFLVGAYCFLLREEWLFGALVVASVFEAASAIDIGNRGIQPYYIIAAFIIVRGATNALFGEPLDRTLPEGNWLLTFGSIGVVSAFLLPAVFAGTPVYDSKVGIDLGLFVRPPLQFGLNNVGQAGFLVWHIAAAYALPYIRFSPVKARQALEWAFYIVVFVVFAQVVFQMIGVPFPDGLIRNNPGYAITDATFGAFGIRNSGTFTEPSMVGALLLFYCVGFTAEYLAGAGGAKKVLVALAAHVAVASSGALVGIALFFSLLLIRYSPFRAFWYVRLGQFRRAFWLLLLLVLPLIFVVFAPAGLKESLLTLTVSKGDSSSFINRTAADLYALELLARTYFLGVGLGSNRASSLLTTLLSNVGLTGLFVFAIFYLRLMSGLPEKYAWLRWAAFSLLFNMCLSIADITIPILWITVLLALQLTSHQTKRSQNSFSQKDLLCNV